MMNCEKQLLASWILGYNRSDIKEFDCFEFYPEIFNAIKEVEEPNIVSVSEQSNVPINTIADIVKERLPYAYAGAYKMLKEKKINGMISNISKGEGSIKEKLDLIINETKRLDKVKTSKITNLKDDYIAEIEERKLAKPLRYGIDALDYWTGGIRKKELTVIAARPSVGKTALALQIAYNLAVQKKKVLFFSLEMSGTQLVERIACRQTNIESEHLKTPKFLTEAENEQLALFMDHIDKLKNELIIIYGTNNLSEIKNDIEKHKPDVVFIDQLSKLTEFRKFNSIREQFTYMTNETKLMAMDFDKPIILMAQINRNAQNTIPTLADLKESGSIEEDADNVLMLHQQQADENSKEDKIDTQVIIRKQRNGVRDKFIDTVYQKKKFRFYSLDKRV